MLDRSDELRARVEARKHELLAKYSELGASALHEPAAARDRIRAQLDVEQQLKNGWNKINDDVRTKLSKWIERSD